MTHPRRLYLGNAPTMGLHNSMQNHGNAQKDKPMKLAGGE
jgi:hypothetical protein